MKRPIIACIALACLTPLSNAVVIYDTMTDNGYDEFLSPVSCDVVSTNQLAVDDVSLAANMKITSISFRLLTNNEYSVGDVLSGYLYVFESKYVFESNGSGGVGSELFGADDGMVNFTVAQTLNPTGFGFDYVLDVKNLSNIDLTAGTYWFGVQVYSRDPNVTPFNIAGKNYGQGTNAMVYGNSGWEPFSYQRKGTDLSMRIEGQELGEPVVPGPAAILPFGIGLAAALRRRRK